MNPFDTSPLADQSTASVNDWRRAQRFLIFLAIAITSLGIGMVIYYALLVPLLISALLSYLLMPFTNRLERKGWPRTGSIVAIIAFFLLVAGIAIARFIPILFSQVQLLLHLVPNALKAILEHWIPVIDLAIVDFGFKTTKTLREYVSEYDLMGVLQSPFGQSLSGIWVTGATLIGGLVNVALIPIVTFFLLKDYPAFVAGLTALVPSDLRSPMKIVMTKVDQTLRSVIKGQVIVAAILTVLYVAGFSIVGLQSAVAIGVVAGICRIVPYLDVIVGGTLSTIVLLSDFPGWGQILGVFIVFMIVQGLDGALITPRVIGERVGLHPVVVILSVIAFGHWFGFWGVLLAIPVVAVAKALITAAVPFYQASKAFQPPWFRDIQAHSTLPPQILDPSGVPTDLSK